MDDKKLLSLNAFINNSYECLSFTDFLRLSIVKLHEFVMYDSGMFFCGISRDCSFFKPYVDGKIENYYKKKSFSEREEYLNQGVNNCSGNEAYVYRSTDYLHGVINIANEPRSEFLSGQNDFNIACMRIVHKGQFMGEIYLHRSKDNPDFDDEDLFTLRLLQPHVSTIFYIIHTLSAVRQLETSGHTGTSLGMCVLDGDLSVVGGNVTGIEMLKTPTVFGSSILYHIKEVCSDIIDENIIDKTFDVIMNSKVAKTPNGDMKIEIFLSRDQINMNRIQYVIIMKYCDKTHITSNYKFKFTKREADIIDGLIQGKNNAQIAKTLNVSENTVKTHIQSIYKKVGACNRTELTYVLMFNRE